MLVYIGAMEGVDGNIYIYLLTLNIYFIFVLSQSDGEF